MIRAELVRDMGVERNTGFIAIAGIHIGNRLPVATCLKILPVR